MTLFNFWKWPLSVIDDIQQWFVVRSALKEESIARWVQEWMLLRVIPPLLQSVLFVGVKILD